MTKEMIRFYTQSQVAQDKILPTTVPQIEEKLERIFRTLEKDYGVTLEEEKISGLSAKVLQQWYNKCCEKWKATTANNYVCILNPFLRWAAKMDRDEDGNIVPYVAKDYSDVLHTKKLPDSRKLPPSEQPKCKYYTDEQVKELLWGKHGRNHVRDRAIIGLILYSSLRVSEVCSLTIGDIRNSNGGMVMVRRKGGAVVETAIGDVAFKLIDEYLKTRTDKNDMDAPLFMTSRGQPCSRVQVYQAISTKQKELGLATGPHALRHTCLSAEEKIASPSVVRDTANHHSFKITNQYVHSSIDERRAALNALPWAN